MYIHTTKSSTQSKLLKSIEFLKWCDGYFSLDEHLEEYTIGEILFGKVFELNLGRWEKTLSKDKSQRGVG